MNIGIDTHHHAVPSFYADAMTEAGIRKVSSLSFPKWAPEQSLKMMDRVGIERAILSVSTPGVEPFRDPPGLARQVNEHLASMCSARPDRFGAFGVIPLAEADAAATEAVYVLDELGFEGICLLSNAHGAYLDNSRFDPLFQELNKRTGIVFVHPTDPVDPYYEGLVKGFYGWFVDTSRTVLLMEAAGVFERYPNITFILGHGGGVLPLIDDIVARRPQLLCDTAKVAEPVPLEAVAASYGPSRITFGSDFPWAKKAHYWKSQIEKVWGEKPELLENVLERNARRILGVAEAEVSK